MVAEARTWVDVEGAVRAWVREVLPGIEGRAFFAFNNSAVMPQVVLFRVAGPDDACLVQFDVWASVKATAAEIAADLASAADALSHYAASGVQLKGARVEGLRWQPDPESVTPRYIVETTFAAYSSE